MGKGLWMGLGILLLASAALLGCGREAQTQAEDLAYEEDSEAGFRRTVLYYTAEDGFVVPVMKRIPWEEGSGKRPLVIWWIRKPTGRQRNRWAWKHRYRKGPALPCGLETREMRW